MTTWLTLLVAGALFAVAVRAALTGPTRTVEGYAALAVGFAVLARFSGLFVLLSLAMSAAAIIHALANLRRDAP